jgi:hypothetical protein
LAPLVDSGGPGHWLLDRQVAEQAATELRAAAGSRRPALAA